ncbi:SDR family oxidoreductase [Gryllotalpicola protaetiae]|uniref:SDR family NAD(P)-dependent oxidoreductase n=1 Tax=Gryllotalpicola protaetiae TaxID=2419771 RepID=A0A387BH35_9MICO|nr:SDR family oxidoreductase [Gryllotalpicola protaetiae]AYG03325.1 SDR family NAD(P)-dependent oxidoreductase [Gryllotalpicola protaetiae]
MVQISGRTALVTGGQRGLGAAFAAELLEQGAERVYVTARNPQPTSDPRLVPLELDVTSPESVAKLVDAVGDVSIVFNNAGTSAPLGTLDTPVDVMKDLFETNVWGAVCVAQAFAPVLTAHEQSALVDVHSALSWLAGFGAYGASKAAFWSFTNSLRAELAPKGVQVLGVHLGYADTDLIAELDVPKISPEFVAQRVIGALKAGDDEVLVDDTSVWAKSKLAGPVAELRGH